MKRQEWAILGIIVFVIAYSGCIEDGEMQKQKTIANQVRPFAQSGANDGNSNNPILHGNALIWDMTSNSRSAAYDLLPSDLRAESSDKQITVFLIRGARDVKVGTYSISGENAYEQYTDISVVYWPENRSAGFYSILSEEPRSSREVQNNPEYGDPNKPIADWIEKLRGN